MGFLDTITSSIASTFSTAASLVRMARNESKFQELRASPHEKLPYAASLEDKEQSILGVIAKMAVSSIEELEANQEDLLTFGRNNLGVHPLKAWKVILLSPVSMSHIQIIFDIKRFSWSLEGQCFKEIRNRFVTEYVKTFEERRDDIETHLDDFCSGIGLQKDVIEPLIKEKRWEDFIYHITKTSK